MPETRPTNQIRCFTVNARDSADSCVDEAIESGSSLRSLWRLAPSCSESCSTIERDIRSVSRVSDAACEDRYLCMEIAGKAIATPRNSPN